MPPRANRKGDKANVVVQFRSRAKRSMLLKKAKKMRLTNNDAGHEGEVPIYVNEHLCPSLKKPFEMAKKRGMSASGSPCGRLTERSLRSMLKMDQLWR